LCEFSPSGAKAPPILAAYVRPKARTLPTFSLFSKNDPNAIALLGRLARFAPWRVGELAEGLGNRINVVLMIESPFCADPPRVTDYYQRENSRGLPGWQQKFDVYRSRSRFEFLPSSRRILRETRSMGAVPTGLRTYRWFRSPRVETRG